MLRKKDNNQIFSVFNSPYLELLRLLHEASEIEHALMLQYLYASFSINPNYPDLIGQPFPSGGGLLEIAVEEMKHLGIISEFLSALGGSPHLLSQDFPYFQDIYPFPLELQTLTRTTLAKYTYVEASSEAITNPKPEDKSFVQDLLSVIGSGTLPNQLGSLYNRVLEILNSQDELIDSAPDFLAELDLTRFKIEVEGIKMEGEKEHFLFFKSVFLGQHPVFDGIPNIWSLDPDDPKYPSIDIATNPSAYRGSKNQIVFTTI